MRSPSEKPDKLNFRWLHLKTSSTRDLLVATLRRLRYSVLELLLTPLQFGIPNSRLRYYLLAKIQPLRFARIDDEQRVWRHIPGHGKDWEDGRFACADSCVDSEGCAALPAVASLSCYLDEEADALDRSQNPHAIPDVVLEKWGRLFDIVLPSARRTCCFTRGECNCGEFSICKHC